MTGDQGRWCVLDQKSPTSGDSLFGHLLKKSLITEPLTWPQYCQLPRCLLSSLVLLASADQRVKAMCLPDGNAAPSELSHGAAMNRWCATWNLVAIDLSASISVLSLAAVSSYQAIT